MPAPLVCLPGMMCDARLYEAVTARFSAERAIVHIPLTRGRTMTEIAQAVLDDAPPHFALLGLSMGGIVAMEVMRLAPERITRLALLDTNPLAETPETAALREPQIVAARTGQLEKVMREELKPRYLAPGPGRDGVLDRVMEMAVALGPDAFVRQSRALQKRPDQTETLKRIAVPTLVLCGRHDTLCDLRRHEFMRQLIPGSVLEVIEDAGHLPVLEQPEATNAALARWMSDTLLLT
ncbi:alpha/beta fold hydrolase [Ovoidimarina sediminis]|uniref:alpha/beta fold hydrolase n=1 Tax=Ovoidimarina sediminis TaxID=3079856 RepID=UPI002915560A|nr:alpha/beta fold hydrolase [Rhodophyticola sp. MJ-SS7]MDU8943433.1 alpha/beta fold hydrolase [Rhodophyticola sp. MJ-SS7]